MKAITPEAVFEEVVLNWGSKHADSKLSDLWEHDRSYLLWAANLGKSPCDRPPTPDIVARIKIAYLFAQGHAEEGERLFAEFQRWSAISMRGEGLSELPRPGREKCAEIISRCNLLAGHSDLDGIYSVAIAMKLGGALEGGKMKGAFGSLKLLRYGHKSLEDYTQALAVDEEDTTVIIDFAAHPAAALTLDHHITALQYWELGSPMPTGIYEPSMPSCPRLLATFCGLSVSEEILSGCDRVDGAIYKNVEETIDLSNPFVALEAALSLDVSDSVAKKVVFILVENDLNPRSVLEIPVWRARVELLRYEIEEQRSFWKKGGRTKVINDWLAVADSRLAPYSSTRFRYLPFELEEVAHRPFLITLRPSGPNRVNIGIGRNPFSPPSPSSQLAKISLGAMCRRLGKGGGRNEAAAMTVETSVLPRVLDQIGAEIAEAGSKG